MSPILGSIGAMSHEAYRGNLDDYADDFSFNNISNAEPGVLYTSGIATITGINNKIKVSINSGGSLSVNGDAFSTAPRFIKNGDEIQLSLTTTKVGLVTDFLRENNLDLNVGKRTTTWTVTTRPKNDNLVPFTFNAVSNLPVGISTNSNTVGISGLEPGFSVPIRVNGFNSTISINGGPLVTSGIVFNGNSFYINHPAASTTDQNSYGATRSILVSAGTYSTTWNITTQLPDLIPNSFSFTNVTGAEINTTYTSNSITVAGINSVTTPKFLVNISIFGTGFEYNINGGRFTNQTGTVVFGDIIRLRRTTSNNYSTTFTGTLVIGSTSSSWSIRTKSQPFNTIPSSFSFSSVFGASLSTQYTSNSITLGGMTSGFSATASISLGGVFRVTRGGVIVRDYSSSSTSVQLGDIIALRRTSSSNYSTAVSTTFSVSGTNLDGSSGTTSASWNINTQSAPAPPPVVVPGCTNPSATNYNSSATVDDGSCVFPCTVITRTSTYGTGFQGELRYGNGKKEGITGSNAFMTGVNSTYSTQSFTGAGGVTTTYTLLASTIINVYKSVIGRFPESIGFDFWINDFKFNSSYTSLTILQNTIITAYQIDGEQQYQIANGGLIGNYDNCGTKLTSACVEITKKSTYGTGFAGYLLYGNKLKVDNEFMTGVNSTYSTQFLTGAGGINITYTSLASTIINVYRSTIGRFPESIAFDGWINDFKVNPSYTSLTILRNTIITAYQTSGEQQYQIANGGLIGNYDNCAVIRTGTEKV